ncbi:tyrosine-type recombinase/integrase [Sphingopyxis chilensis]
MPGTTLREPCIENRTTAHTIRKTRFASRARRPSKGRPGAPPEAFPTPDHSRHQTPRGRGSFLVQSAHRTHVLVHIMEKTSVKPSPEVRNSPCSSGFPEGYSDPPNDISGEFDQARENQGDQFQPWLEKRGARIVLDGNFARRKLPVRANEYCIWDSVLPGFGMRVRPTGRTFWFVRLRHRDKHRRISLGCTADISAELARTRARKALAEAALDGLPKRIEVDATPELSDYVNTYWNDIARYWKASTERRNRCAWERELAPVFGSIRVADISRADIMRWRDDYAGAREGVYNRTVPVLASLFKYAEALRMRRKGSNPCRGIPRYKRLACERYLTPLEYRHMGAALRDAARNHPTEVAVIRMLLYTGARVGEIRDLRWEWVRPPHLALPDSKTGPKTIWLNSQALAVLASVRPRDRCPYVFPNRRGTAPVNLAAWWPMFRRSCAMPDLRLHDIRHSFASAAIMDNVPLATIGKLLGHLLPETTAKYAHLADEVIAEAAVRVSGGLARAIGLRL